MNAPQLVGQPAQSSQLVPNSTLLGSLNDAKFGCLNLRSTPPPN